MAATRYTSTFKVRTDIRGQLTPNFNRNSDMGAIEYPQGDWKPASWLPVAFTKTQHDRGTHAFVISSKKAVAFDRTGRIVPAGLRGAFVSGDSTGNTLLTYTSDDYDWGVYDLVTGERYATDGTTNYSILTVTKALIERGLVPEDTVSSVPHSSGSDCLAIWEAFIGYMVGAVDYDVHVYAGRAEDGDMFYHNWTQQHAIQFCTQPYLEVPHRVAGGDGSDAFDVSAITPVTTAQAAGDFPQPGEVWKKVALAGLTRYSGVLTTSSPVVALALSEKPVAKNTSRTPVESDIAAMMTKEKTGPQSISAAGHWFLDENVGLLFIHEDSWDTLVSDDTDPTITYSYYDNDEDPASILEWPYFDGEYVPGADLSIDKSSNYVISGGDKDIYGGDRIIGQIYFVEKHPRQFLENVKTAFQLNEMPNTGKVPGSATGGYPTKIFHAREPVADQVAILKLRV